MGNFTKIERYLNDIENHLELIARSIDSTKDVDIFNTVINIYYSIPEVSFVEGEKQFAGFKFTVYIHQEAVDRDDTIKDLEGCEKIIFEKHPSSHIEIVYAPVVNG